MVLTPTGIQSKEDLFDHALRRIYQAEQHITQSLPEMIDIAASARLRSVLEEHLEETNGQVMRLEGVFALAGLEPEGAKCEAIEGIIREAETTLRDAGDGMRDAAMVPAAQAVEHYEIACYGTLVEWAKELGKDEMAAILIETLEEEKAADRKLSAVAKDLVNRKAA